MTKSLGKRVSREAAAHRLFAVLEACALEGRPCPANGELGELLGYDQSYPSTLVKHLELQGLIRVARGSRGRIVTILTDGPAKGCSTDGDHARIRAYHQVQRTIVRRTRFEAEATATGNPAVPLGQLVARDPCPCCGVRGDVGCRHRAVLEPWRI
jgi:hypothetical protein